MEKLDRLNQMYEYACANNFCKNKKTFAALLNMNEGNLSSAFSGKDTRYLTNNLLLRINVALGEVFSPAWLLYGEGEMLISDKSTEVNIDNSTNIGHHNNMGHHNSIGCTTQAITPNEYADLQAQNADLQAQIDALHSLVTSLRERIDDLRKDKENLYQLLFKK